MMSESDAVKYPVEGILIDAEAVCGIVEQLFRERAWWIALKSGRYLQTRFVWADERNTGCGPYRKCIDATPLRDAIDAIAESSESSSETYEAREAAEEMTDEKRPVK